MIFNLFRKSAAPDAAQDAYRAIVAQSRRERFYAEWGIPDTVTGRFDMISLHLVLALRRLRADEAGRKLAQAIVDVFFSDMDGSLRELGVTDIGVPNKIKKIGNVFYGLVGALDEALASGQPANVAAVLRRNIQNVPEAGIETLADYLLTETQRLAALSTKDLFVIDGAAA